MSFINIRFIVWDIKKNILGITENWGRWSDTAAVKLPDIMSGSIEFENKSIRVLEWLVILVGFKIKRINELEARESKNSFV